MNSILTSSGTSYPGWPRFAEPVGDGWLPIRYWQYWDFAREFAVKLHGRTFTFENSFLEEKDDYAGYFEVYDLGSNVSLGDAHTFRISPDYKSGPIRRVDVSTVLLDSTRKSFVHQGSLPADLDT